VQHREHFITEADTLLLTVPNQLGVVYNAHVIEVILTHVAPPWGGANEAAWRRRLCYPTARFHLIRTLLRKRD